MHVVNKNHYNILIYLMQFPYMLFRDDKFHQQLSVIRVRAVRNLSVIRVVALAYPSKQARAVVCTH